MESKHFANESVTTEKVARKSITKEKLADNAVDASQVVDGSIGNAKLSPDSVTTENIKNGSVTNEKIADNTLGIGKFDPELRKTIQAATGLPEDLNQMIQDVDKSVKSPPTMMIFHCCRLAVLRWRKPSRTFPQVVVQAKPQQ